VRDFDFLLRGCRSILYRFGWISHRLDALRENTPSHVSDILEEVGTVEIELAPAAHPPLI
jgi:hypothetical protein